MANHPLPQASHPVKSQGESGRKKVRGRAAPGVRTTLGARIVAARAYAGMSQNELEQRLWPDGSGAGRVSRYESNQRGGTALDPILFDDMARELGVDFRWLVTGRGHMLGRRPYIEPEQPLPSPSEIPDR